MLQKRFNLAGRLSVVNAIVTVLHIVAGSLIVTSRQSPGWPYVFVIFLVLEVFLCAYVLTAFMRVLNDCFGFYGLDSLLAMLIWNSVFLAAAGMVRWLPGRQVPLTQVINLLMMLFGVVSIILGVKLLKSKTGLYELARPLAYGFIVTGVAYATVFFMFVALIAGVFVDILLAAVLFRAAKSTGGSSGAGAVESSAAA